jgi:hypothetical protein
VESRFLRELLPLLLQAGHALTQAEHPGLTLSFINEPISVTIDHPRHPLPYLAELLLKRGQGRAWGAGLRRQPAPIFLRQSLGVRQQGTDFLPDGEVQPIRPHLGILTDAFPPEAVRIGAQATVIGVRARLALAGTGAEALPIVRIATVLALPQALEPRERPATRLPGMASMLLHLLLDRRHHLGLHNRGHRDGVPFLLGDVNGRHGPPWLTRPSSLRPQARSQRFLARLAKGRRAQIRRMLSHPPDHTAIPDPLPRAGDLACPREPATDLANRQAVAADPVKPLADQSGFLWNEVRARLSTPLVCRDVAVAIGRSAEHMHRAHPRRMPLATAVAFHDLGALRLGDPPLHRQEEVVFRALAQRPVEEDDLHPGTPALLHQQHLIGVCARQPIGGVHRQAVHRASRDDIA